jgi:hypothetical protein
MVLDEGPDPAEWTYTFTDMRTQTELATLPLTRVKFDRVLRGIGKFTGYLPLDDDEVRALNPWGATRQRRTALYIEYGNTCVWGGPVTGRLRQAGSEGIAISGMTFEGWLARQRLLADLSSTGDTRSVLTALIAAAQATTGIGLGVETGPVLSARSWNWKAREVKPVFEMVENIVTSGATPMEWLIDCYRNPAGVFQRTLRVGEPRLGRAFEATGLTFAYPGPCVDWQMPEDGSGADNVMPLLGSGSGDLQPFGVLYDTAAGIDEIASGYPTWMRDYRNTDTDNLTYITSRAVTDMRAGINTERLLTGVVIRAAEFFASGIVPADDLALEITHPAMTEYPGPVTFLTRLLGLSVSVGDGGKPDAVAVTIGAA